MLSNRRSAFSTPGTSPSTSTTARPCVTPARAMKARSADSRWWAAPPGPYVGTDTCAPPSQATTWRWCRRRSSKTAHRAETFRYVSYIYHYVCFVLFLRLGRVVFWSCGIDSGLSSHCVHRTEVVRFATYVCCCDDDRAAWREGSYECIFFKLGGTQLAMRVRLYRRSKRTRS